MTEYAPGASDVTSVEGAVAAACGEAGSSPARPAQSFPLEATVRRLLVQRAMTLHFVAAQDGADALNAEGHADALEIQIEGLREAAYALENRLIARLRGEG